MAKSVRAPSRDAVCVRTSRPCPVVQRSLVVPLRFVASPMAHGRRVWNGRDVRARAVRLRRLGRIRIACTQQIATIWLRLYEITGERRWLDPVDAVLRFLKSTQNRATENPGVRGGIKASNPLTVVGAPHRDPAAAPGTRPPDGTCCANRR